MEIVHRDFRERAFRSQYRLFLGVEKIVMFLLVFVEIVVQTPLSPRVWGFFFYFLTSSAVACLSILRSNCRSRRFTCLQQKSECSTFVSSSRNSKSCLFIGASLFIKIYFDFLSFSRCPFSRNFVQNENNKIIFHTSQTKISRFQRRS